jgi:hypothetical protein
MDDPSGEERGGEMTMKTPNSKSESGRPKAVSVHLGVRLSVLFLALASGLVAFGAEQTITQPIVPVDQERGREIIARFVETNRYWLIGPPPAVRNYSYVLQRIGGTQAFNVENPAKAPRAQRQGVTYSTMLHQLATKPGGFTVRSITDEPGRLRLTFAFEPAVRGACGNGVENSWNGYFNLSGDAGYLVLDAERFVPLEAGMGKLTEKFGEFVAVDATHFVPLTISIQKEETRYDWRFRLHEPGLWLFDDGRSDERRLAWVENVKVNSAEATLRQAAKSSAAREQAELAGQKVLRSFLDANRHWLLPSLDQRRGLIYEYRQEAPYLERVFFDSEGNLFARLEASKESPDKPTRQQLWLADGRKVVASYGDPYMKIEPASVPQDQMMQHFAMGVALECALTRLAREPDAFWAETLPSGEPGQYRLVLHSRKNVRLFAGTMLGFTSWAYMHDVAYDRSEIVCDAATHRPLSERDFAGKDELKGEFHFEDWLNAVAGTAPGRIRAVIPYQKDGKDQSLEMEARFHNALPGVWLLDRVESHFRGNGGGSTGTVSVVSAQVGSHAPIADALAKVKATEQTLAAIQAAPEGRVEIEAPSDKWQALPMKAVWTDAARKSAEVSEDRLQTPSLIGVHRVRSERNPAGELQLSLEGVSTTSWKEFETEWKASWRDASGRMLATAATNLIIRAENAPAAFVVTLTASSTVGSAPAKLVSVEGRVRRMTGEYHGHGMWMRFTEGDK